MKKIVKITLSVWVSCAVFIPSLFFKFSNHPNTQDIFNKIADWAGEGFAWFGSYGGYIIGVAELIASIFLLLGAILAKPLLQKLHGLGAWMSLGIMTGAIFFHLATPLGIKIALHDANGTLIGDDDGRLFITACTAWLSALALIILDSKNPKGLLSIFKKS